MRENWLDDGLRDEASAPDAPADAEAEGFGSTGLGESPDAARAPEFVYAIGRIEPRFPSLAVEREFAQVRGARDTAGMTDHEVLHEVLTARSNRYLARRLCWILTIEGLETYILAPQDPVDLELL